MNKNDQLLLNMLLLQWHLRIVHWPHCLIVHVACVARHPLKEPASVMNQCLWTAQPQTDKGRDSTFSPTVSSPRRAHCQRHPCQAATPYTGSGVPGLVVSAVICPQRLCRGVNGAQSRRLSRCLWSGPRAEAISQRWEERQAAGMGFSMAACLSAPGFDVVNRAGKAGWQRSHQAGRQAGRVNGIRRGAPVKLKRASSCCFTPRGS